MSITSKPFFAKTVQAGFEATVANTRNALKANGFGILTEIDFQKTFKEKLDKEILPSLQLGACMPGLAFKAYSEDESIATMLPCHVLIQQQSDKKSVKISFADPKSMFQFFMGDRNSEILSAVAAEADERLHKAFDMIADE